MNKLETIKCDNCDDPAHGVYKRKRENKVIRCLNCAPNLKIVMGFKPLNMHLKNEGKYEKT